MVAAGRGRRRAKSMRAHGVGRRRRERWRRAALRSSPTAGGARDLRSRRLPRLVIPCLCNRRGRPAKKQRAALLRLLEPRSCVVRLAARRSSEEEGAGAAPAAPRPRPHIHPMPQLSRPVVIHWEAVQDWLPQDVLQACCRAWWPSKVASLPVGLQQGIWPLGKVWRTVGCLLERIISVGEDRRGDAGEDLLRLQLQRARKGSFWLLLAAARRIILSVVRSRPY